MAELGPLTTGQAARYCSVSQATILNWIKQGTLKAYATPGGHYRILLPEFLTFLENHKMPVDPTLRRSTRRGALVVSDGPQAAELAATLRETGRFDVVLAKTDFEAAARVTGSRLDAVVLDLRTSALHCQALCRWLRTSPEGKNLPVLAVGNLEDRASALAAGADAHLPGSAIRDRLQAELEALLA